MNTLDDQMNVGNAELSAKARSYISSTAPWMRFLGILGMIFSGLMILGSFFFLLSGSMLSTFNEIPGMGGFPVTIFGLIYLLMGAFSAFIHYLLYKAGSGYRDFIRYNNSQSLEESLGKQRLFWTIVGVMALIMIVVYILAIVGGVIAAMSQAL